MPPGEIAKNKTGCKAGIIVIDEIKRSFAIFFQKQFVLVKLKPELVGHGINVFLTIFVF